MEQIFMIEAFVRKIILKIEPPEKDEEELKLEEERRKEAEKLAALEAATKGKKGKGKPKKSKGKKGKKSKKGKEPPMPSEEEIKFMQSCTVQMNCLPIFDFYVAHDNFVPPPPPEPPGKKKKGKAKKAKKKGKKGKKQKGIPPVKLSLPSDPLPTPPFFGVGNSVIFLSRPSKLEEIMKKTPIHVAVWNRDEQMNCIGFCTIEWHESFYDCLQKSAELNPVNMEQAEYRITTKTEIVANTVELAKYLQCEEDLKPCGEVELFIRLTCLGNRILSYFVTLPEMERIPARKYLQDDHNAKDMEVVRHWEGTEVDAIPPIAHLFGASYITLEPIKPMEEHKVYEKYIAPFTDSELVILAMGFPKGPCGGTNCPKRLEFRDNEEVFVPGETVKGKYEAGQFVNRRDVHGPCGRLDCPLAKKIRSYICNEGTYKACKKPCPLDYY